MDIKKINETNNLATAARLKYPYNIPNLQYAQKIFARGRDDLDPLRGYFGIDGGMLIINPYRPILPDFGIERPLPKVAIPPGARFDPFGPPLNVKTNDSLPLAHVTK